jgi:hypothetical protein
MALPTTNIVQAAWAIYSGGTPANSLAVTLLTTTAGNRLVAVAAGYNGVAIASIAEGAGTPGGTVGFAPAGVATAYAQAFISAPLAGGATTATVKLTSTTTDYWVVYVYEVTKYFSIIERHVTHTGAAGSSYTNGTTLAPSIVNNSPAFGLVWVNGGAVTIGNSQGYFTPFPQVNNSSGASTLGLYYDGTAEGGITCTGTFSGSSGVYVSLAMYLTMVRTGTGTLVLPGPGISGTGETRNLPRVPPARPGPAWLRHYFPRVPLLKAAPVSGLITGTGHITSKKESITGLSTPPANAPRLRPGPVWQRAFTHPQQLTRSQATTTGTGSIVSKKETISGYGLPPGSAPPLRPGKVWRRAFQHPQPVPQGATPRITGSGHITAPAPSISGAGSGSRLLIMSLAPQAGIDPYGNAYPQGLGLTAGSIPGQLIQDGTVAAIQLQSGINVPGIVNASEIEASVILQYLGPPAFGNLFYSNAPGAGTDQYGNAYAQGERYYAVQNLEDAFSITNPAGQVISTLDTAGNISGQTISAGVDLILAGNSLQNTVLPSFPTGLLNRGWTPDATWPPTPVGTAETPLLELDQILAAGRAYRFRVIPAEFHSSVNNTVILRLRYTTNGTTPTTASPLLREDGAYGSVTDPEQSPYMEITLGPTVAANYRMLVTGLCTTGTFQFARLLECQFEDIGLATPLNQVNNGVALGTGTGGGTGKQTYTTTFLAQHSYAYYGAQASNPPTPNGIRAIDGSVYQGNDGGPFGSVDSCYSFVTFDYAAIQAALAGAVINSCTLLVYCSETSLAGNNATSRLGYAPFTTFGSVANIAGATVAAETFGIAQGQTLAVSLGVSPIAAAFQSGAAKCLMFGPGTYLFGIDTPTSVVVLNGGPGNLTSGPALTFNYTK